MNEEEKNERINATSLMKKGLHEYTTIKNSWGKDHGSWIFGEKEMAQFNELMQKDIMRCWNHLSGTIPYDDDCFLPNKISKFKEPIAVPAEENDDITLER